MAEKTTATLPSIRITERLELALLRAAARDQRVLSDYVRVVLERHCFGHAASLADEAASCQQCNAVQCDARNPPPDQGGGK